MANDEPTPRRDRSGARVSETGGVAGPPDDAVDVGLLRAREYAALSAAFDPVEALRGIEGPGRTDAALLTAIAADLSRDCDTVTGPSGDGWLMRSAARRRVLDRLVDAGRLDEAIRRRRDLPLDEPTADLLDAVTGQGAFTASAIATALRDGDRALLERTAIGLGRADGHADRRADLPRVKSALIRLEMLGEARGTPGERVPAHADELERILGWLDTGFVGYQPATLYVEGLPGVGKSTLVEEVAARLLEGDDGWVVVRFDFERSGLDVQDTIGLSLEFARQVSAQVPGSSSLVQQARQQAAGMAEGAPQLKGDSPERVPEALALALRRALDAPAQRVLLVLDDLELLGHRGATHPARLFEWIAQLADLIQTQIAVIGVGPGEAVDGIRARIGERVVLPGLDPAAADRELERLGVDRADRTAVREIAKGDPLSLGLAARLVRDHGADAVRQARGREGMTAAYLYRALLSHVADPDLRRVVGAALVARRVDVDAIVAFVGPSAGLRDLAPDRAERLVAELAQLDWAFEPDPLATGFLRSVPELGRMVRPTLYDSAPVKSARIDRDAARWFGARREPWAATEAAYHLLQLMRRSAEPPTIEPAALARLDPESIAELPPNAQEFVRLRRELPAEALRNGAAARGSASGSDAVRELRSLNGRSDWLEGDDLFERAISGTAIDPASPDSDVVLTFLWRSGRWTEAGRLLARQGGWRRSTPTLDAELEQSRLDGLCRLEMGAESGFAAAVEILRDHDDLRARVAALVSEPMLTSLAGAALGFALHRADPTPLASERRPGHDPVAAAVLRWGGPGDEGEDDETALAAVMGGLRRIEDRTGPIDIEQADRTSVLARAAAVLTPFADLLETMSRLPRHQHLADYAAAVQQRLGDLGNLAPLQTGSWTDRKASRALAVHGLAELGLLAELAGAAAYLRRDRDLRLVAAAAERWRRTVAGSWAYGPQAPAGWDRPLDVTMTDRLAALLDSADPAAAAAAQLEAWAPEHASAAEVLSLLRARSPKTAGEAARTAARRGPAAAAAFLLRRSLPSAFVPPVAVLLAPEDRRPPPGGRTTPPAHPTAGPTTTIAGGSGRPDRRPDRRNATMTDERQDEERRRGDLRRRLDDSPALREAVQRAATTGRLPDDLVSARSAEALDRGDELESVIQLDALEAIVKRVGRPPLIVRNDAVELEELPDFAPGTDALIKGVERSVLSVGRVEFVNHSMAWGGTGWVIHEEDASTRIVATNRHVAKVVAQRGFDGSGVFLRSPTTGMRYGAEIDFKEEVASNPGDARPVEVVAITYLADDASPDVALLRIVGDGLPSPLPLADAEAEEGQLVAVIGYPAYDSRNDAADQAKYFRDLYEVKRFAPGFVMQGLGGRKSLTHDCTSLGGNSGSPLIGLDDGKVVGLHFAGRYGVENHAVGVGTLRRLIAGERPLAAGFEVARAEQQQIVEAASDGVHQPDFFGERAGYDPDFLEGGLTAPWPGTPAAVESGLARPSDEDPGSPFELRYTHFGVKYHLARRQPLITAVNIDGEHPVRIKRTGDKWFRDARIPIEAQLTRRDYDDPEIDRGHMVRREDPNWDPDATSPADVTARAKLANDDTFHYTNSALQHSRLNQGKELWQGLENYILDSARTEGFRACVFTGPILRPDDPELAPGLAVPQEFWKVVVMPKAGGTELHATAYLLSQGELIRDLLEKRSRVEGLEGFVLGPYRTFQIAISDLAEGTGLDLAHYVEADPLRANAIGAEAIATGEPLFVPLDSLARIVV